MTKFTTVTDASPASQNQETTHQRPAAAMAAESGPIPAALRGPFFSEYYVYDGGPGDEDGAVNGEVHYTTYFGQGPFHIKGLKNYVVNTLGVPVPSNADTDAELLYSFEDINNQNRDTYSPVYLYSYGHLDAETGILHQDSPGAMIQLNPGQKLVITTKFSDLDLDKSPEVVTSGVAFMEGGGAGSTNMHFHGTNVSPKGYGDNVDIEYNTLLFPDLETEGSKNVIKLPKSHHEGLSWWHPHFHSSANGQVYGGAFGNLQIGDSLNHIAGFENATRNFIGIKNFNVTFNEQTQRFEVLTSAFTPEDTARNIHLVNGEFQPSRSGYTTGTWNSFSFINYTSNSFYNVKIVKTKPGVAFNIKDKSTWGEFSDVYIYGKDGYQTPRIAKAYSGINNTIMNGLQLEDPVGAVVTDLPSPDLENNLYLSPARRFETLTYFKDPGEYKVISEAWTGAGLRAGGWIWPDIELATLVVEGPVAAEPALLPSQVTPTLPYASLGLDLSQFTPLRERRITWSGDLFVEGANRYRKINGSIYDTTRTLMNGEVNRYGGYPTPFLINDNILPYNPALIAQLDTLEYWNHENWASEQHPFHPHQNHFQVVSPKSVPSERLAVSPVTADSAQSRSVVQLFMAYLGRLPNPDELVQYTNFLVNGRSEEDLASELSTSTTYRAEFQRFYITERDYTKDFYGQVADGAYYTLTRENIYDQYKAAFWATKLFELGFEKFPLYMLQTLRSGSEGAAFQQRLVNLATAGLYAVNKVAQSTPFVVTATALLRVLNQQISDNPVSVTRLLPIIDELVQFDPNQVANGESYYGSLERADTIALPAAMIKSQSYSSPSSNRYPAPAAYNEWEPGLLTTATTYDNYTGGYLQHCHILPHEDSGQAIIIKIIENMERSWLASKKEFAPGEVITIERASNFQRFTLPAKANVGQRIAFGDVNKDGYVDVVVGEADGGSDLISVYNGIDLTLMGSFHAFSPYTSLGQTAVTGGRATAGWNSGVHLDVGDVTGDGLNDIVVGAGQGGGNLLSVFSRSPSGFYYSGSTQAFSSNPELADATETRFTLGDFDADNFVDFAFIGSQAAGNYVEVKSSRLNLVLSLFQSGLSGEIGLTTGFSSYQNLGLETLYLYEKYAPTALMKSATLRAAKYVAHSKLGDNPYFDAAKYKTYVSADEQVLLSQPIGILESEAAFDWVLADIRSLAGDLGPAPDPVTGYREALELDATFAGYLANPVLGASRGQARELFTYTSQQTFDALPGFSSDAAYVKASRDVIGLYVTHLQRLPSPAELHRLARRLADDGRTVDYVRQVITYRGAYDPANPVSVDAIHDQYYNHATGDVRYAYQGITKLSDRSTYRMIGDDFTAVTPVDAQRLANIVDFGLYFDAQVVNNMNVDGDIMMFLGPSQAMKDLLKTSYASITANPVTVPLALGALNASLKGNYTYPLGASSPLANGLNVESSTYESVYSPYLHEDLLVTPGASSTAGVPVVASAGIFGHVGH